MIYRKSITIETVILLQIIDLSSPSSFFKFGDPQESSLVSTAIGDKASGDFTGLGYKS